MSIPFNRVIAEHEGVRSAASLDGPGAAELWRACKGDDDSIMAGSFHEAVCDVLPPEHLALLVQSDVAAAYAFDAHWQGYLQSEGRSPFEWRELAREGWSRFIERAERTQALAEGFGWDLSAAWEHERDVHGTSRVSTEEVEAIARLAGQMFAALKALKASRVSAAPEEVHSIELGNDVGRLLPTELMHLGEPTEALLLARIVDRRALQYAMRGRSDASRGPLAIALDESSSMHDEGDRSRNVWAKATAIAMARVALEDGRKVSVVHYSVSCVVRTIEPGNPGQLVELARHFLGGGTNIAAALSRAATAVSDMAAKGDKGADVVVVTDGEDGRLDRSEGDGTGRTCGEAALDAIEALGSRLWTVAIDCDVTGILRDRAAKYVHIGADDMRSERSVSKLADAV